MLIDIYVPPQSGFLPAWHGKTQTIEKSKCNFLNKTDGGDGVSGIIQSATTRQKRSDALTGRKQPNISAALKGIPKSAEHNAKNSASKLGVKKPKIAEALAGKQNKLGKTNKNPYPLKGLPKPKISCKHCGFMASIPSIARYHNNNCKKKETV